MRGVGGALGLLLLLSGCGDPAPRGDLAAPIALALVADGLDQPVAMVPVPGRDGAFLVAQQTGRIVLLEDGQVRGEPVLDLSGEVTVGYEQGLLGLALQPDRDALLVDYTDTQGPHGRTIVARYPFDPAAARVTGPAERLLEVPQPYANHNGGHVTFGPDGMLYVGLGDGGSFGDPDNRAQDTHELLGKILRIDVREATDGRPYAIPPDNPFADGQDGAPEVWAYGLRNPWRFSFDRATGDLWIGDVGQGTREEVNFAAAGSGGGRNYGWSAWEGTHRYSQRGAPGAVDPVAEYPHSLQGVCSVTGGFVYRGGAIPGLAGTYLFADHCTGEIWAMQGPEGRAGVVLDTPHRIASFAEGRDGELHVLGLGGAVLKVVPAG